jgi:hypothetical protein
VIDGFSFFDESFFVFFDVFGHQIFSGQFVKIWEVINDLTVVQFHVTFPGKNLANCDNVRPVKIPSVVVVFFPKSVDEILDDYVFVQVGFPIEFDSAVKVATFFYSLLLFRF